MVLPLLLLLLCLPQLSSPFLLPAPSFSPRSLPAKVSPFESGGAAGSGLLPLTLSNVELVLDDLRPYLQADGGDVKVAEIDGPIVRLELVGECGTCPSSTQTMKMGLERQLKERIPEIAEVVQSIPTGPELTEEQVDVVLASVRPFLAVAGGDISCLSITGVSSAQPTVALEMVGASASLTSVKMEIQQRVQRHFVLPGLRVTWE